MGKVYDIRQVHPYLVQATQQHSQTIDLIERLVQCESPSDSGPDLRQFLDLLEEETRELAVAKSIRCGGTTPCLRLDFRLPGGKAKSRNAGARILGLGHADTVWSKGTLAQMPFREAEGRLWGPGVLDMKAGLAFFIAAVRLLRDLDVAVPHKVALLVVPDEETGSGHSREVTEAEAKKSQAVLVLEPGTGLTGKLKTSRKGVGRYLVSVHGKSSHAGVDFGNGASAILELARQIKRIGEMTNLETGRTVNPGVIKGGTHSNVIAAEASVEVDVRIVQLKHAAKVDHKLRALKPVNKRCTITVEGGLNRPPMERTEVIKQLYKQAFKIAAEIGFVLEESATGGGSDGNFTAAAGIPTLDGLGAVGEGAHAENESILTDRIDDRVALLAGLMVNLQFS